MGYFNMNEVEIGRKVRVKNSDLTGNITEIFHFPTTFKVEFGNGKFEIYKTHEIELFEEYINDKEKNE